MHEVMNYMNYFSHYFFTSGITIQKHLDLSLIKRIQLLILGVLKCFSIWLRITAEKMPLKKKKAHTTGFTSKNFLKYKNCIPQCETFLNSKPVSYSACFTWGWGQRMLFHNFLVNSDCSQTLADENTTKSFGSVLPNL